jgi:hypothetical protein
MWCWEGHCCVHFLEGVLIWLRFYIQNGDSSVSIATCYGLEGPGFESGRGKIFRNRLDRPWGPPSSLCSEYRLTPGIKRSELGVHHPPSI